MKPSAVLPKVLTEDTPARPVALSLILLALILLASAFSGCAITGQDHAAQWSATGEFLQKRAMTIAGHVVLNAATAALDDSDADWLDSAAAGLRASSIVTSDDVRSVVAVWTPDDPRWSKLAADLADTAKESFRGADLRAVVEALARGLEAAASSERQP